MVHIISLNESFCRLLWYGTVWSSKTQNTSTFAVSFCYNFFDSTSVYIMYVNFVVYINPYQQFICGCYVICGRFYVMLYFVLLLGKRTDNVNFLFVQNSHTHILFCPSFASYRVFTLRFLFVNDSMLFPRETHSQEDRERGGYVLFELCHLAIFMQTMEISLGKSSFESFFEC